MDRKSKPSTIRLTEEGKQLRKLLAKKLGISESAIVELSIREMAEKRGVKTNQDIQSCSVLSV